MVHIMHSPVARKQEAGPNPVRYFGTSHPAPLDAYKSAQTEIDDIRIRALAKGLLMRHDIQTGEATVANSYFALSRTEIVTKKTEEGHHYWDTIGGFVTREQAQLEFPDSANSA